MDSCVAVPRSMLPQALGEYPSVSERRLPQGLWPSRPVDGPRYLASIKVQPQTQSTYMDCLKRLRGYLVVDRLPKHSPREWDQILVEFVELLYNVKKEKSIAPRSLAAWAWADPSLGGPLRRILLEAMRSVEGRQELGLALVCMFEAYLQAGMLLSLRPLQVIPAAAGRVGRHSYTSSLLHLEELKVPS